MKVYCEAVHATRRVEDALRQETSLTLLTTMIFIKLFNMGIRRRNIILERMVFPRNLEYTPFLSLCGPLQKCHGTVGCVI